MVFGLLQGVHGENADERDDKCIDNQVARTCLLSFYTDKGTVLMDV